jgi:phage host-nuclease inhibitor protein Gam
MSLASTETLLRNAKHQLSQSDINQSLIRAIGELMREIKDMENEMHRLKRSVQMSRRFG